MKFEKIPTSIFISRDKESILDLQLEKGTVAYLSKDEVVYVFYPTDPIDCYPYFPVKLKEISPIKDQTIPIECLVKDGPIKDEGNQIHLNHDNSSRGIRRVIKQTVYTKFWSRNWGLI